MTRIKFTVDTNPIPKARPRLGIAGKTYTPQRTRDYEQLIAQHAALAFNSAQFEDISNFYTADLGLIVRFYRKDNRRCDLDNLLKAIKDACNGVIYYDDSQIVALSARLERNAGKQARVEIEIMTMDEYP